MALSNFIRRILGPSGFPVRVRQVPTPEPQSPIPLSLGPQKTKLPPPP